MVKVSFGERLKELRDGLGLTQDQIADQLGTFRASISRYETGKRVPDVDFVRKVALTFKVSMDWLAGASDNKNISIVDMKDIPELAPIANGYIEVIQSAYETGLTPDEIREVIALVHSLKKSKN